MRKFLYSKWFFLVLAVVCLADLVADVGVRMRGWWFLNWLVIPLDAVAAALALWVFVDLHKRRPRRKHGDDTRG
jgi:hypothetical protein